MDQKTWPGTARRGALALALAAALAGPRPAAAADTPAGDAAHAGAALGVDLYRIFALQDGNVFFSPYSVSEALALLSAGAGGRTQLEILRTLHWTRPPEGMPEAFKAQDLQLDHASQGGAILSVANGLWFQRGREPRAAFLDIARREYRADVRVSDFGADLPVSRRMINYWVAQKTGGKILELLPNGALTPFTRLVLANAIYFKGEWEQPFKADRTVPRPFFNAKGQSAMAPAMTQSAGFRTAGADGCDLLELPYAGGELSMVVLLPRTRDGLPDLEQRLSADGLSQWMAELDKAGKQELVVTLPRFKMSYTADLSGPLAQLGMATAFKEGQADLSGINGKRDLYVSAALHKAFVDVNEEGTEAAAATGMVMQSFAVHQTRTFTVDHPFLFLIRDTSTGSLLFLGRIVDPKTD
jgi:serpin B